MAIKEEFEALFANRMNAAFTGHFKKAFYEWLAEYEKQVRAEEYNNGFTAGYNHYHEILNKEKL